MKKSTTIIGCPYLGLLVDPETRVGSADILNHCFCKHPPRSVDLAYQDEFCLSDKFTSCEIYKAYLLDHGSEIKETSSSRDIEAGVLISSSQIEDAENDVQQNNNINKEQKLPHDDYPDWKKRLHEEAKSNLDEVSSSRKGNWLWGIGLIIALIFFVVFAVSTYNRWEDLKAKAQLSNNGSEAVAVASVVNELGGAADAYATAASIIEMGAKAEATREAAATATAIAYEAQLSSTINETPTLNEEAVCEKIDEIDYTILDGPIFSPEKGYYYVSGTTPPDIQVSWIIENSGGCSWETVYFLSLADGRIIYPTLIKDGEELDPLSASEGEQVLVKPGEQVEVAVPFDVNHARNVDDDFVLMVNKISLADRVHAIVNINGWVITIKPQKTSLPPTPTKQKPSGGGSSGGRPTPTPASGRG